MKRIILLIMISVLSVSGFSQNVLNNASHSNSFIQDDNFNKEVKIYPNPCKQEKVTIEFSESEIAEIRLTNIAGKEVLLKKFDFTENKKQIQLSDIPNGIYLMRIKTIDDKQVVKKLIVAKD